jgi:hypothetical protein
MLGFRAHRDCKSNAQSLAKAASAGAKCAISVGLDGAALETEAVRMGILLGNYALES